MQEYKRISIICIFICISIAVGATYMNTTDSDFGDYDLNHNAQTAGNNINTGGWAVGGGGLQQYNETQAYNGSLSIMASAVGSPTPIQTHNDSFHTQQITFFVRPHKDKSLFQGYFKFYSGAAATFFGLGNDFDANNWVCNENGAGWQNCGLAFTWDKWFNVTVNISSGQIMEIWVNNTKCPCNYNVSQDTITQFMFYMQESSDYQMTYFVDDLKGGNYTAEPAPPNNDNYSIGDIFLRNLSSLNYIGKVKEGENFLVLFNYTNSTAGTIGVGTCNTTLSNGILEYAASNSDYTLCSGTCDYSTYLEEANFRTNNSYKQDFVHLQACNVLTSSGSIQVNISCGSNAYSELVLPSEIPLCSAGYSDTYVYTSICSGHTSVNFSTSYKGDVGSRKLIHEIDLDREYYWLLANLTYNATTTLYNSLGNFEYYAHSSQNISVNCTSTYDIRYNITYSENFTIVNIAPKIYFGTVNTSLGFTNLTNNVVIEYAAGIWNFYTSVIDDDLTSVNYTFYNSSGMIYSYSAAKSVTVNTSNELFVDFTEGNRYNLTINATDSFGNSTKAAILFNITDTTLPTYTGFSNTSVTENTLYTWNATLSDQYLWGFNITCTNGFNYSITGIAASSYNFINSTNISETTTCYFNITDAHTAEAISDLYFDKTLGENKFTFDNIELSTDQEINDFTFKKLLDRYNFCIELSKPELHLDINIPETCVKYPSEDYKGWYVCNNEYWLDFEGSYPVTSYWDHVTIDLTKTEETNICFNSIGELNKVSGTQLIEAVPVFNPYQKTLIESTYWFNFNSLNTSSTAGILLFFFIFIILVGALIYSEYTKIPIIFVLTGIIWFFFSLLIYSIISAVVGILLAILSFFIIIRGFFFL